MVPTRFTRHNSSEAPWLPKLRTLPAAVCPSEKLLELFVEEPLALAAGNYAHIVRGCSTCRKRLHRLLLEPATVKAA